MTRGMMRNIGILMSGRSSSLLFSVELCICLGWTWWWLLMREYPLDWEFQRNFRIHKGPKFVHLGICEIEILLSNSWIVLCIMMKCGMCFLQMSRLVLFVPVDNCWVSRFNKVTRVKLSRVLWGVVGLFYLCDVLMG